MASHEKIIQPDLTTKKGILGNFFEGTQILQIPDQDQKALSAVLGNCSVEIDGEHVHVLGGIEIQIGRNKAISSLSFYKGGDGTTVARIMHFTPLFYYESIGRRHKNDISMPTMDVHILNVEKVSAVKIFWTPDQDVPEWSAIEVSAEKGHILEQAYFFENGMVIYQRNYATVFSSGVWTLTR